MPDPIISPDGKWMWTGTEWIPAPPTSAQGTHSNINLEDSMMSGDVNVEQQSLPEGKSSLNPQMMNDVLMALDSLGYKDKDVSVLVKKQIESGVLSSSEIIKNILREL